MEWFKLAVGMEAADMPNPFPAFFLESNLPRRLRALNWSRDPSIEPWDPRSDRLLSRPCQTQR